MRTTTKPGTSGEALTEEFEQFFREHHRWVYRVAYGMTRNREDAEDVSQAVFLTLFQGGFPPGLRINPKGYLHRTAVNKSRNLMRARRRQRLSDDGDLLERYVGGSWLEDSTRERLRDAIADLPEEAAAMLLLCHQEKHSYPEIAKITGKTLNNVAVTLHRTRNQLKRLMSAISE